MKKSTMNFTRLFTIILIFVSLSSNGQEAIEMTFNQNKSSTTVNATARDRINLDPGFRHTVGQYGKTGRYKVDETLILDDPGLYQTPKTTENRTINTSLPVGGTQGSFSVSKVGGAVYNFPITIPKGVNNLEPGISITYNSHAMNSALGLGWNISGVSKIERVGSSIYYDGETDKVTFDFNTNCQLDGMRLISNGGNFKKEYDDNSSIARYYELSGDYFVRKTIDGKSYYYGYSPDSRFYAENTDVIVTWALTKIVDKNGNYINYYYKELDNKKEYVVDRIEYCLNENQSNNKSAKIQFLYSERDDIKWGYLNGAKFQNKSLLRSIKTYYGDAQIKEYEFKYFSESNFSKLNEIVEYDYSGNKLNSTIIEWNKDSYNISVQQITNHPFDAKTSNIKTHDIALDFDGDGVTDVLKIPVSERGVQTHTDETDFGQPIFYPSGNASIYYNTYPFNNFSKKDPLDIVLNSQSKLYFGDFNADGVQDILVYDLKNYKSRLYARENGNLQLSDSKSISSGIENVLVGDFDGDQDDDFAEVLNGGVRVYVNSFTVYDFMITPTLIGEINPDKIKYSVIDFDGNGKDNIIVYTYTGTQIYEYEDGQFVKLKELSFPSFGYDVRFADFNGDGLFDIFACAYGSSGHPITIGINTGNEFKTDIFDAPVFEEDPYQGDWKMNGNHHFSILDYNGDGISDIVEVSRTGRNDHSTYTEISFNLTSFLSNGSTFLKQKNELSYTFNVSSSYSPLITYWDSYKSFYEICFKVGDFNGDGRQEILHKGNYNDLFVFAYSPYEKPNLVKSITDGFNEKLSFTFNNLCRVDTYLRTTCCSGDFRYFNSPLVVLENVKRININNNTIVSDIDYEYDSGVHHKFGKGILGFEYLKSVDAVTGMTTIDNYNLNTESFTLILDRKRILKGSTQIYKAKYDFSHTMEDKVVKLNQTSMSEQKYNNTLIVKDFTYTPGNNISTITITAGNDYRKLDFDYISEARGGLLLYSKVELNEKWGINNGKNHTYLVNEYDGFGNPQSISVKNGNVLLKTVTTEHDVWGNLTMKKQTADADERVTSYTYTLSGRFLSETTDYKGYTAKKNYNEYTDLITSTEDYLGQTESYSYDGVGRVKSFTDFMGNTTSYTLDWGDLSSSLYAIEKMNADDSYVKIYYDFSGREVKTVSSSFGGKEVVQRKVYSDENELERLVLPTFVGENENAISYQYYTDSRVKQETCNWNGATKLYNYEADKFTVTFSNLFKSTKKYSGLGYLESVDESGMSVLSYSYISPGIIDFIEDIDNNKTDIDYDKYGERNKLVDPDAGENLYEKDGFGNLLKQTDANGNSVEIIYSSDEKKLVNSKIISDYRGNIETINYTYNSKDQLESVLSSNFYGYNYEYNNNNKVSKIREITPEKVNETNLVYDNLGRILRKLSSSGMSLKYQYDGQFLARITDEISGTVLWQLTDVDPNNLPTLYTLGNGLSVKRTFSPDGKPLNIEVVESSNILAYHNVDYDKMGNVLTRSNKHIGSHSYYYDHQNQLRTVWDNVTGSSILTLSYSLNGNISDKSDVGTYEYNSGKPHAVTAINPVNSNQYLTQTISYTAFNKTEEIVEGEYRLVYTYGVNQERKLSRLYKNEVLMKEIEYGSGFEIIREHGEETLIEYIHGGDGVAAMRISGNMSIADGFYYIHKDHLGSISEISNSSGDILIEYDYSVWGQRSVVFVDGSAESEFFKHFNRGFTGHEHIEELSLINMNGRMYDPVLARFLSTDNYVQSPENFLSLNRYSYCLNNPLVYNDPTGEVWNYIIGGAIGFAISYGSQVASNYTTGSDNPWGDIDWIDVGVSVVSGAFTCGIGSATGSAAISTASGQFALLAGSTIIGSIFDLNFSKDKDQRFSIAFKDKPWQDVVFDIVINASVAAATMHIMKDLGNIPISKFETGDLMKVSMEIVFSIIPNVGIGFGKDTYWDPFSESYFNSEENIDLSPSTTDSDFLQLPNE